MVVKLKSSVRDVNPIPLASLSSCMATPIMDSSSKGKAPLHPPGFTNPSWEPTTRTINVESMSQETTHLQHYQEKANEVLEFGDTSDLIHKEDHNDDEQNPEAITTPLHDPINNCPGDLISWGSISPLLTPLLTPEGFIHIDHLFQLVANPEGSLLRKMMFDNVNLLNNSTTNNLVQVPTEASTSKIRKRRFRTPKASSEPTKKSKTEA